jgi:hypothetical protein
MSAADENPLAPGSEPESQDADLQWLQTLAEPELVRLLPPSSLNTDEFQSLTVHICMQDLMISLKELAVTQAADPCLARRFHLRTLRALGVPSTYPSLFFRTTLLCKQALDSLRCKRVSAYHNAQTLC